MLRAKHGPEVLASRGNIMALLMALDDRRALGEQILAANGIENVTATSWYPLQNFVDALIELGARIGPTALREVGRKIPDNVAMPPGIKSFEDVCAAFDRAFELNHRGPAGGIDYEMAAENAARIITRSPYPCQFDEGVIYGFFRRLLGSNVVVTKERKPCKSRGDTSCTYFIEI